MAQGPEVPKAQIRLRELIIARAKNGYHPDGGTSSESSGSSHSDTIPNYTHHPKAPFKKPIPNSKPMTGITGRNV